MRARRSFARKAPGERRILIVMSATEFKRLDLRPLDTGLTFMPVRLSKSGWR